MWKRRTWSWTYEGPFTGVRADVGYEGEARGLRHAATGAGLPFTGIRRLVNTDVIFTTGFNNEKTLTRTTELTVVDMVHQSWQMVEHLSAVVPQTLDRLHWCRWELMLLDYCWR